MLGKLLWPFSGGRKPVRPTRASVRLTVSEPVRLAASRFDAPLSGTIEDLSAGGCCLRTSARLKIGDVVTVSLNLGKGLRADLRGRVIYERHESRGSYAPRFGIRFVGMTPEESDALENYISSETFVRQFGSNAFAASRRLA